MYIHTDSEEQAIKKNRIKGRWIIFGVKTAKKNSGFFFFSFFVRFDFWLYTID